MRTTTKIRWLLLILTLGLFATTLTARWASTRKINLENTSKKIASELIEKELFIYSFLAEKEKFNALARLEKDAEYALELINYFDKEQISFQTFRKDKLIFWSDNFTTGNYSKGIKDGTSFLKFKNGWFEVVKKTKGSFNVVFFIPVKSKTLNTKLSEDKANTKNLIKDPSIDIASFTQQSEVDIRNKDGKYLYSIVRNTPFYDVPYSGIEVFLWIAGFTTLLFLINSLATHYAEKGSPLAAALAMAGAFTFLRFIGINYHFPEALYSLEIFNPRIYAANYFFPSIADLGLNIFLSLWVLVFIHNYKSKIIVPVNNRWLGYLVILFSTIILISVSYNLSELLRGLIYHSNINFKVTNILNLNIWTFLGIFILCLALLSYFLITYLLIKFSFTIQVSFNEKLSLYIIFFVVFNFYKLLTTDYSIFFLLIFLFVTLIARIIYLQNGKVFFPSVVLVCLLFAAVVSIKLTRTENEKEQENRKRLALKLESADDPNALVLFSEIEKEIVNDQLLKSYYASNTKEILLNDFQKNYFSAYLGKFDFSLFQFNTNGESLNNNREINLQQYLKLADSGSIKLTNFFYRVNNTFGIQHYFALLPIKNNDKDVGTIVIELRSKHLGDNGTFHQFLKDGTLSLTKDFNNYSYAFYDNGKLLNQSGEYIYDLNNKSFPVKYKDFVFTKLNGYSHLIYNPEGQRTIIISRESHTLWRELASLSFFFIIFLLFSLFIIWYKWVIKITANYKLKFRNLKWKPFLNTNKMQYRIRIQLALVLAVVSSLVIIGIITFSYITIQYKEQQEGIIQERIKVIGSAFEQNVFKADVISQTPADAFAFDNFSKMYSTDLNLFDIKGDLLFTTQPKIYSLGIITNKMNAKAFIHMDKMQQSEYLQIENIGNLQFTSAYIPIRNIANNVIAYLQLPYFSNQDDYNQKIGTFLNLLINIYVLVFVAIGFFAFVVANQITSPLSLIQESLSKTVIGRKNKPIPWQRNDEIGNLIKEYNAMLIALEESATRLARSERETAWREMAKQVAHEIKNPLTPLRLGIQMLDRSWKEKDKNFDEKFQKFSKSFLEQIDSLSHIASEFSNFAKMPEAKFEIINIYEILSKTISVYAQTNNIVIKAEEKSFKNSSVKADKDQLLRMFNNLLKNAIEAIPDDKNGIIAINAYCSENEIEIKIQDNGSGIPNDLSKNIFTPNFTTKSSGTGLGLAFVKQAVEIMGGHIYFTTEINVGTTFFITLPLVN